MKKSSASPRLRVKQNPRRRLCQTLAITALFCQALANPAAAQTRTAPPTRRAQQTIPAVTAKEPSLSEVYEAQWAESRQLTRTWEARNGEKLEAKLLKFDKGTLTLQPTDGSKSIQIRTNALSLNDQSLMLFYPFLREYKAEELPGAQYIIQPDVPAEVHNATRMWEFFQAEDAKIPVFQIIFYNKTAPALYRENPIVSEFDISNINANIITLKSEGKTRWYKGSRRWDIDQIEEDLYSTNISDASFSSIKAYFRRADFQHVSKMPKNHMENGYGPVSYYVHGKIARYRNRDALLIGALADEPPEPEVDEDWD